MLAGQKSHLKRVSMSALDTFTLEFRLSIFINLMFMNFMQIQIVASLVESLFPTFADERTNRKFSETKKAFGNQKEVQNENEVIYGNKF